MYKMMENCCEDPCIVLQKVKEAVEESLFSDISEFETTLKYVLPAMSQTVQQIYAQNDSVVGANEGDVLHVIKDNFQVALSLMDCSNDILQHLIRTDEVAYSYVPSLPVNIAYILLSTFTHCKNSQKIYSTYYKSVSEILDLFRKTQEVHSKYLIFLDSHLIVDFLNENETVAYNEVLEILLKISKTLTGVNMKSMADNWKGFISLVQKSSAQNLSFSISPAIHILREEIYNNLTTIFEEIPRDSKKASQDLKITSFLVKVALKLLEIDFIRPKDYEEIFKFWLMVYSLYGRFFQIQLTEELGDSIEAIFNLCLESTPNLLCGNTKLIKHFWVFSKNFDPLDKKFGLLMFTVSVLQELPNIEPEVYEDLDIVSLIQLILSLSKSCYTEYFYDHNSIFYEDLVTWTAVTLLHFPDEFPQVEKLLIESIIDVDIWTALIAIDVWCLVLNYSTELVRRSTLTVLVDKLVDLKLGTFHRTPAIVRLKILTQRVFKMLPLNAINEEVAKYNTTSHLSAWKILSFRNVPLSHRYYVEFLMCDIFDKMEILEKDCSLNDMLSLMEGLNVISYTKFNELEINATRLTDCIAQLWSFNFSDVSSGNQFLQYFVCKLLKITMALSLELKNETFLPVFTQLRSLLDDSLCKLLICGVLKTLSRRSFNNYLERNSLFAVITSLFKQLLADKNSMVVQLALESFFKLSNTHNYVPVVSQVMHSSSEIKTIISNYTQKRTSPENYDINYLEKIRTFQYRHRCYEWTGGHQPVCKKIRIDNDSDRVINELKIQTEKLLRIAKRGQLTADQRIDIKFVVGNLEEFLK